MKLLGLEPTIKASQIVGVAVRNLSPTSDSVRIGINSGTIAGYGGFKFYSSGRNMPGIDYGWWSREFTFDFAMEIELISGGCWPFHYNAVFP